MNQTSIIVDGSPLNLSVGRHSIEVILDGNLTIPLTNFTTQPVYYISNFGNDSNSGLSPENPWKTPKVVNNAEVVFASGQTFHIVANSPLDFSGKNFSTVTTDSTNPATLLGAASGVNITKWWADSINCTLENFIIDSIDGSGDAGNVRGSGNSLINIDLKNLNEGFDYVNCQDLTILDGKQVGKVNGRCHYFLNVKGLNWHGGNFGPSISQSPIRFSSPGVSNGVISDVNVSQVGSSYPIATWAIHAASGLTFIDCVANGGQFSFNSAGEGLGDVVIDCVVSGLNLINTKLDINSISYNNKFLNCIGSNQTGECISVSAPQNGNNIIDGANLTSPIHGIHFYSSSNTIVKNSTLNSEGHPLIKLIDGNSTPQNDGGGNSVK